MLGRWASHPIVCYALSALVIAAVLYPLSFDRRTDSFPLSSYPMFARFPPRPIVVAYYLVAVGPGDYRRPVPPDLLGSSEVLQAQATIRGAVRRGPRAMRALCERAAAAVARDPSFDDASEIRLLKGKHDAIDYLTGADTRGVEKLRVQCRVPR